MTARVILYPKTHMTEVQIFNQWDGSLRPNFGDRDGWFFIRMFAGAMVKRDSVVRTFLLADFTAPVPVGVETFIDSLMLAAASWASFGIIYGFDNLLRAKHFHSTGKA